jgi:hypothetical protein
MWHYNRLNDHRWQGANMITNRVGDLTVDELRAMLREEMRALIRETVQEVLEEVISSDDPDTGLEFKPEIAEQLQEYLSDRPRGRSAQDVMKDLGLLEDE